MLEYSKEFNHPLAIKYPKGYNTINYKPLNKISYGKWEVLNNGEKLALISYGRCLEYAYELGLKYNLTVINALFIKPIDIKLINKLIKEEYKTQDIISFKKGHFYKHCFDIYKYFCGLIIDINIFILFICLIDNNIYEYFVKKILLSLVYANYLYFGPFLFFVILFFLKHGNELIFKFSESMNEFIDIDYVNIFFIFLMVSVSFPLTFLFPFIFMYIISIHSIQLKNNGNFLFAKIFWFFASKYATRINQ